MSAKSWKPDQQTVSAPLISESPNYHQRLNVNQARRSQQKPSHLKHLIIALDSKPTTVLDTTVSWYYNGQISFLSRFFDDEFFIQAFQQIVVSRQSTPVPTYTHCFKPTFTPLADQMAGCRSQLASIWWSKTKPEMPMLSQLTSKMWNNEVLSFKQKSNLPVTLKMCFGHYNLYKYVTLDQGYSAVKFTWNRRDPIFLLLFSSG